MDASKGFLELALGKLEKEYKSGKYDKYARIMKESVKKTLADFCRQDEEFAQAVAQGGSFEACMKAVATNCGSGISDLEAYSRAAAFYFPGCKVRFQMRIELAGEADAETQGHLIRPFGAPSPQGEGKGAGGIILDLADFL